MGDKPEIQRIDPLEPPDLEWWGSGLFKHETLTREELERRYGVIIIDEASNIPPEMWRGLLPITPDPPMQMKNGKLVRRHHPIPQTPRSPRRGR